METKKRSNLVPTRRQVEDNIQWAVEKVKTWPEWKHHLFCPVTNEEWERRLRIIRERRESEEKKS